MNNKNLLSVIILFTISLTAITCKKAGSSNQPEPVATPIGIPIGSPVSKTIGSAGGTVVSGDGMFELIIPAGALSANTVISIQSITNYAPGGMADAYRCLPDGQQFAKDITLKIHYRAEDLANTDVNCMGIAFQNKDQYWQVVNGFTNDSTTKVITASVNHFTDYTIFHLFHVEPDTRFLKLNESGTFKIIIDGSIVDASERVQLIALLVDLDNHPVVWKANGITNGNNTQGRISGDYPTATYTAPASVPSQNPVSVSADINIPFTIDGRRFNQLILTASAYIRSGNHKFSLRYEWAAPDACGYNGQNEFDAADMQVDVQDDKVTLSHFTNRSPLAINPANINFGNCTISATAGSTGFVNITSGTGTIELVNGEKRLRLDLKNSGATSNTCSVTCTGQAAQTSNSQVMPDHIMTTFFVLKDSLQKQGNRPGIYFELKPIP